MSPSGFADSLALAGTGLALGGREAGLAAGGTGLTEAGGLADAVGFAASGGFTAREGFAATIGRAAAAGFAAAAVTTVFLTCRPAVGRVAGLEFAAFRAGFCLDAAATMGRLLPETDFWGELADLDFELGLETSRLTAARAGAAFDTVFFCCTIASSHSVRTMTPNLMVWRKLGTATTAAGMAKRSRFLNANAKRAVRLAADGVHHSRKSRFHSNTRRNDRKAQAPRFCD